MQCSQQTKRKQPCPIEADRLRDGKAYCHIHDPEGVFRKQVQANREDRPRRITKKERRAEAMVRGFKELRSDPPMTDADRWLRDCKANRQRQSPE